MKHLQAETAATPREAGGRRTEPRVSCVLPCYDEADSLDALLPRLRAVLADRFASWEIVLVDDGSRDRTPAMLEVWTRSPGVEAIELSRNFGKEAALTAGLEAADGDVVVLLDADGQHPPELIGAMVERWRAGAEVVYAARADRADEGVAKRLFTRLFYALVNAGERVHVPDDAGDFRLMDRRVVDALLALPERNRFMKGLYAWVGFRIDSVPYRPPPREHGASRFGLKRLLHLSVDALTAFTTWPLRVASAVGVVLAALAFAYGLYLTVDYLLYGHAVSGWTTIVVLLLGFSGLQLLSLGVLGEYIARITEEVKARPLYLARRRLGARLGTPLQ